MTGLTIPGEGGMGVSEEMDIAAEHRPDSVQERGPLRNWMKCLIYCQSGVNF